MTTIAVFLFSFFTIANPAPPDSISLEYCYRQAYENYPIAQNIELQRKITGLNVDIANSGYFPQVNASGKATYQSEVTEFSTPNGGGPPPISKDQYEASVDVTQTIFNAGAVGIRKDLERAEGEQKVNSLKVQLHDIRSQVDQVYFGILMSQQQAKTINLLLNNLNEQLSTVRSRVENGVLLASQQHILEAELIKTRQDSAETRSNIRAGYKVLGELIGENIPVNVELTLPKTEVNYRSLQPQRPEYEEFKSAERVIDEQRKLSATAKWPHLAAFGTAAYGRPGLNFLNNDFHDYYIAGLRVQWNLWDFVNAGRKSEALQLRSRQISQNREVFTRQLNAQLHRIGERIETIRENIDRDRQIVELRDQIVEETASQLKHGVITATEYITELTQANQAQLSLFINRVRLAQAQTEYATALGISVNKIND